MGRKSYLNGEWNFMPDYEMKCPTELIENCSYEDVKIRVPSSWKWKIKQSNNYEPYDIFQYPAHWNEANSGVLGRNFEVKPGQGERIFLIFKGVLQNWQVFVNNVKVLQSQEAFLPVEVDITDFVNQNTLNDLKVWCGPFKTITTPLGSKQVGLTGSWFAQSSMGIWQDVILEYRSESYFLNPLIKTSFKEKSLEAQINVVGFENKAVLFSITDGGTEIKSFGASLSENKDGIGVFKASINWSDPTLWMPDEPHMYKLNAQLKADDKVIDALEIPFGFREVWCEKNKFYLNGVRVNLRGDAWHYQGFVYQTKEYALNWFRLCKQAGMNFVRLHAMPYPEFFLEAADEVGMMIIDESAIYGSGKQMQADNEEFIENSILHLEALVKRDRNHPSVIMWSMQNEMRWVDGRDVYKHEMKKLIAAMKALDPTRPISFDGDNRLVAEEDMEVVSMHYNIDGTIASWDKTKPLAFGEHGKWHYVSPQVACDLVGGSSYESYDSCLLNMSLEEELFNEYARGEDVTALGPFNMGYYMMKPMPREDTLLSWDSLEGPFSKPKIIKKYSMTINNGLLKDYPIYTPNTSYKPLARSFNPVVVIADEYDTSFFGGNNISRNFSVYNDTYSQKDVKLSCILKNSKGKEIESSSQSFLQLPGERETVSFEFTLPSSQALEVLTLELKLYHSDKEVYSLVKEYKVYPSSQTKIVNNANKKILYIGIKADYDLFKACLGMSSWALEVEKESLKDKDIIVLGRNYNGNLQKTQVLLNDFVSKGGFLIIMEQDKQAPGDIVLSGRKYPNSIVTIPEHPIFKGLSSNDFSNWSTENVNVPDSYRLVINAFEKPVKGDFKVLLECGEGDFGWGGLLWASMLSYKLGYGNVLLHQLDITGKFNALPQARLLFENILTYAINTKTIDIYKKTAILGSEESPVPLFFEKSGLKFELLSENLEPSEYDIIIAEAAAIQAYGSLRLKSFVSSGGELIVLPMSSNNCEQVEEIADLPIKVCENGIYQVRAEKHILTEGILPFDCYHFENVTYSPASKENAIIAENSIEISKITKLFINIKTPWEDMFVNNLAGENIKLATVQFAEDRCFEEQCFGGTINIGKGHLILCQIKPEHENPKITRLYNRILSNLGAEINTDLLTYIKEEKDFGIGTLMALPYQSHNDYLTVEAYFTDKNYLLNNLGEGVYGWMKRVEKKNGFITIEKSAGKTYFLTVFIQSDINRNPLKREANVLPDSSIVPDFLLSTNCGTKLFVNGSKVFDNLDINDLMEYKIDDIMLDKGINRLTLICFGGTRDIKFNGCFVNKYGDFINDLKYKMTLD